MKPYSQDLRERVIAAVQAKRRPSLAEIARTFGVSESTVDKWVKRWRDTRSVAARPFAGGRRRALRDCTASLRAEVKQQPDATLAELCERVAQRAGVVANPSMMCRELQRLGLPRKKKSLHDSQRDTPRVRRLRRAFVRRVTQTLRPVVKRLKFLDESGAHLGLTRRCGRAAPGVRVVEATPGYSGPHYTLIAALGWSGLQAPWLLDGAMDTAAFEVYVQHVLAPTLRRGDVLLLDNLSAHASERARALIEARGARVEFLPPYSPDLNPIEKCWAKVKEALRAAKARTLEGLMAALRQALLSLTHNDVVAWFAHCGYAIA